MVGSLSHEKRLAKRALGVLGKVQRVIKLKAHETKQTDIIILGAGVVGLLAALLAARAGFCCCDR